MTKPIQLRKSLVLSQTGLLSNRVLGGTLPAFVLFVLMFATMAEGQATCAFVNDNFPSVNTVEGYMVSGTSAVHVGPVATGGNGSPTNDPTFFGTPLIAIAPGTTHLYASDSATSDIALFDINSSNCALTFVANFPSGGNSLFGLGIAISPNGKFLYASNGGRAATLAVFVINSDGSLGGPLQTLSLIAAASTLAIAPNGKILITTQPNVGKQVASFVLSPSSGKAKLASTVGTDAAADGVAIDAQSKFIYVGDGGEGGAAAVQVIEIGAGAKLKFIANHVFNGIDEPVFIPGGSNCMHLSPNGEWLYFTDQLFSLAVTLNVIPESATLSFNGLVDDGEKLTDEPSQIALNPAGTLLFTGDFSSRGTPSMGIFQASAKGKLKSLGDFPLAANAAATSIASVTF
jgi:6-phosphogluconolactonase (cycloisomerase 2 family)